MISDHISSTNVKTRDMEIISSKPDNEDVNNNNEPHASNSNGQEKEIHVIVDLNIIRLQTWHKSVRNVSFLSGYIIREKVSFDRSTR
jgi:hypothetical protein